jgi:hypothetical protein
MATISQTGQRTIERAYAYACGWVHGNGLFGPGRFLKLSKADRKKYLTNQARKAKASNGWVPVKIVPELEGANA